MKQNFIIIISISSLLAILPAEILADKRLARGTAPGELYVHGVANRYLEPTFYLYRSIDYGQSFSRQNDTAWVSLLGEGASVGEVYKRGGTNGSISYSDNFGTDFVQKNILGSDLRAIASGYTPGEIYACIANILKYSSDYGETFVDTSTFPTYGVRSMCTGHLSGELYCGCSLGRVYYSNDYGVTFELVVDKTAAGDFYLISQGSESGEIYFYAENNRLYYSPDYGDTVYAQHQFYSFDWMGADGLVGGFTPGEVYVLETFIDLYGVGDTYIHRSTDYGQTFTPYHVSSNHVDTLPPLHVDDLTCVPSDSSIFLEWSPIANNIWNQTEEVPYYVVYRNLDPDFVPSPADSIGYTGFPSYLDPNSRWSTQSYYYVVKAIDDSGNKSDDSIRVGRINKLLSH